jgi:hypothetical protein
MCRRISTWKNSTRSYPFFFKLMRNHSKYNRNRNRIRTVDDRSAWPSKQVLVANSLSGSTLFWPKSKMSKSKFYIQQQCQTTKCQTTKMSNNKMSKDKMSNNKNVKQQNIKWQNVKQQNIIQQNFEWKNVEQLNFKWQHVDKCWHYGLYVTPSWQPPVRGLGSS